MSHKADTSFFDKKLPWSKRKDQILEYYLKPYLAKVKNLRKPIVLIDGFAGPGVFGCGEPGSPRIICTRAQEAMASGASVRVICIEPNEDLFRSLKANVHEFEFAIAYCGTFQDHLDEVARIASQATTFLYLDPWTLQGLDFSVICDIAKHIHSSASSIELLMNFNAPVFVRLALQVVKARLPESDTDTDGVVDGTQIASPTKELLTRVVGGDWWIEVVNLPGSFLEKVCATTARLVAELKTVFPETGYVPLFAKSCHRSPKYCLIFGTRRIDGLLLMNDAMERARKAIELPDMFEESEIKEAILQHCKTPIPRDDLIASIVRQSFAMYSLKSIRAKVTELLKNRALESETGKIRINGSVRVWRVT